MRFCLISHSDYNRDGRLRNLLNVFSGMGELFCVTGGTTPVNEQSISCHCNYLEFIYKAVRYAMNLHDIDFFIIHNRKAAVTGLLLRNLRNLLNRGGALIYDCVELYLIHDVKHLAGKIGCVFEKRMINQADIIICANPERAEFMRSIYDLKVLPLVYENKRQLHYENHDAFLNAQERFKNFIHDDEVRIISSSGCSIFRRNDVLVQNLLKVNKKCRLFLCGKSSNADETYIRKLIQQIGLDNVEITGSLTHSELKFLIQHSHIGIVNYNQNDLNNKFCASGKLYEFVYEGIPVVTTTNPPLKNLCDEYKIGISDDEYFSGINEVLENYDYFVGQVRAFTEQNTVMRNDAIFSAELKTRLSALAR